MTDEHLLLADGQDQPDSIAVDEAEVDPTTSAKSTPRLLSLDAFRGLVIAVMILVDDAGPAYSAVLDHSPWNGITLAVSNG